MKLYGELSDQELLDLLRSGDPVAYTKIYYRYKFILYQHAWNKVLDKVEAPDILQDVFSNLWLKREASAENKILIPAIWSTCSGLIYRYNPMDHEQSEVWRENYNRTYHPIFNA